MTVVYKMPALRTFRYPFDVGASDGESSYFCVSEMDFAARDASVASAEGQAATAGVATEKPTVSPRFESRGAV